MQFTSTYVTDFANGIGVDNRSVNVAGRWKEIVRQIDLKPFVLPRIEMKSIINYYVELQLKICLNHQSTTKSNISLYNPNAIRGDNKEVHNNCNT